MTKRKRAQRRPEIATVEQLETRQLLSSLLEGRAANDLSASALTAIGPIRDSSGLISDFAIGAPFADPAAARANAGEVYVIFGGSAELNQPGSNTGCVNPPARVTSGCDLINNYFTTRDALLIQGEATGDRFGYSVAGVGDVTNDGVPDLLVGAPFASGSGRAYLIPGSFILTRLNGTGNTPRTIDLSVAADLAEVAVLTGATAGDQFGTSVAGIGRQAFLVGAPNATTGRGTVDVYQGFPPVLRSQLLGPSDQGHLGGIPADRMTNPTPGDSVYKGYAVSGVRNPAQLSAPDQTNPDQVSIYDTGDPDVLVGAPEACFNAADRSNLRCVAGSTRPGMVFLLSGDPLLNRAGAPTYDLSDSEPNGDLNELKAIVVHGAATGDLLGAAVSSAGNIDGIVAAPSSSNKVDFAFSAPERDLPGATPGTNISNAGEVYLVFGREVLSPDIATLVLDEFGAGTGCVVRSGGSSQTNFQQCRTGSTDPRGSDRVVPIDAAEFVGDLPVGLVLRGVQSGERAGMALSEGGNVQDPVGRAAAGQGANIGAGELLIGSPFHDAIDTINQRTIPNTGRAYMLSGSTDYATTAGVTVKSLSELGGAALGAIFPGRVAGDNYGIAVAGVRNIFNSPNELVPCSDWLVGANGVEVVLSGTNTIDVGETEVMFGTCGGVGGAGGGISLLPFVQPGTFGPQLYVPGYWSYTNGTPPAGIVTQYPLQSSEANQLILFPTNQNDGQTLLGGLRANDMLGTSVTAVGQIVANPAGFTDFALGAPFADSQGRPDAGEVYVMLGDDGANPRLETSNTTGCITPNGTDTGCANVDTFLTAKKSLVIFGEAAGDRFGFAMAGVGDTDADQINDILVGAPFAAGGFGRAYLIPGSLIRQRINAARLAGGPLIASIDLGTVADRALVRILTGDAAGDGYGTSVAGIGTGHYLIGAPGFDNNRGVVDVFQGLAPRLSRVRGPAPGAHLGGIPAAELGTASFKGTAVSGVRNPALLSIVEQNDPLHISVYDGPEPDVLLGAPDACFNPATPQNYACIAGSVSTGISYLLSGTTLIGAPREFNLGDSAVAGDLNALKAIVVRGAAAGDRLGTAVSSAGNIDGEVANPGPNNALDFMFGAPNRDVAGTLTDAGEAYLVFGREVRTPDPADISTIHIADATGNCRTFSGAGPRDNFRQCRSATNLILPINAGDFELGLPVGLVLKGQSAGERAGMALAEGGNVLDPLGSAALAQTTRVGAGEIIIGAPTDDVVNPVTGVILPGAGSAYVLLGDRVFQQNSGQTLNLGTLNGSDAGRVITGHLAGSNLGISVAGIGNVFDSSSNVGFDWLIGANRADVTIAGLIALDAGETSLHFGATVAVTTTVPGFGEPTGLSPTFKPGTVGPFVPTLPFGAPLFLPDRPGKRGAKAPKVKLGPTGRGRGLNADLNQIALTVTPPAATTGAKTKTNVLFSIDATGHLIGHQGKGAAAFDMDITNLAGGPTINVIVSVRQETTATGTNYVVTGQTAIGQWVTYSSNGLNDWSASVSSSPPASAVAPVRRGRA